MPLKQSVCEYICLEFQNIRMQLKYLKAYLFTCKQSVAEELKKRVWPREYMLDHVHLYSVLVRVGFSVVKVEVLWHSGVTARLSR